MSPKPILGNEAVSNRPDVAASTVSDGFIPHNIFFTGKPFISFENIFLWIALSMAEQKNKSQESDVFVVGPGNYSGAAEH